MANASSTYQPRRPERGALHQLVRGHFETFRAQAAHWRDGQEFAAGRRALEKYLDHMDAIIKATRKA